MWFMLLIPGQVDFWGVQGQPGLHSECRPARAIQRDPVSNKNKQTNKQKIRRRAGGWLSTELNQYCQYLYRAICWSRGSISGLTAFPEYDGKTALKTAHK